MNKKVIGAVLSATMIMTGGTTVLASGAAEGKTFAIVTKAAGNPYNEKEADGFKEAIEDEGGKIIIKHPETATADAHFRHVLVRQWTLELKCPVWMRKLILQVE